MPGVAGLALAVLLVLGGMLLGPATGEAKQRLRVIAKPASVAPGEAVRVTITGTRARRCALSLRPDRYRAKPSLRRRVARSSKLRITRRIAPGAKVLVVRCGRRRAHTSVTVDRATPAGDVEGVEGLDDDLLSDEGFLEEEFIDDLSVEDEPIEVPPPPVTGAAPDAKAPSKPTGLAKSASSTSTITLSWKASTDNVKVTGYSVFRSGTRVANVTGTSHKITGLACGKSYPLGVSAYDAAGNKSATASLTAGTAACPPVRKVAVAKGASAQGMSGCASAACRYIKVSFSGFSTGSHKITCRASGGYEGGFYSYTRSGASNTSAICYYGFPGRKVWATVDGVASAKVTW